MVPWIKSNMLIYVVGVSSSTQHAAARACRMRCPRLFQYGSRS